MEPVKVIVVTAAGAWYGAASGAFVYVILRRASDTLRESLDKNKRLAQSCGWTLMIGGVTVGVWLALELMAHPGVLR
jgi:hypothetical protein